MALFILDIFFFLHFICNSVFELNFIVWTIERLVVPFNMIIFNKLRKRNPKNSSWHAITRKTSVGMYKNSKMFLRKNKVRLSALALRVECDIVGYCVIKSRRERRGREEKKNKNKKWSDNKNYCRNNIINDIPRPNATERAKEKRKIYARETHESKEKNNYNNNTKWMFWMSWKQWREV